jgi:hypothetical protein
MLFPIQPWDPLFYTRSLALFYIQLWDSPSSTAPRPPLPARASPGHKLNSAYLPSFESYRLILD